MDFCGEPLGLGELLIGIGLVDLLVGLKFSGISSTKLEGKTPIALLSRHSLPVHHEPSPALRHSIRSPSMKPRSRLLCKDTRIGQSDCRRAIGNLGCVEVGVGWEVEGSSIGTRDCWAGRTAEKVIAAVVSCLFTHLSSPRVDSPNPTREPRRDWWWCGNHIFVESRCQSGCRSGAVGLDGVGVQVSSALEPARTHAGWGWACGSCRAGRGWLLCQQDKVGRPTTHTTCEKQPGSKAFRTNKRDGNSKAPSSKTKSLQPKETTRTQANLWTDRPGAAEDGMDPDQTELEL